MEKKLNGYVCFHKGRRFEIYSDTTGNAQQLCAKINKIKRAQDITVVLAEKGGETVTHTPDF